MAFISAGDGYLTVLNLFGTDSPDGQRRLLEVMRDIIDSADYDGWISSTLFGGEDEPGTANYIQWRSAADLERRYEGEKFRHETIPLFNEISTSIRLLKTEVVFSRLHPSRERIEISPQVDDYSVIVVMGVEPDNQQELVELFGQDDEWVTTVPGYRSNSILRGLDGTFVVNIAQWESKERYDAFHQLPEQERPADVRAIRERARSLLTSRDANTYRVVHTRSADVSAPS
ncbi:Antibiotic biosynthesis monooxygenase [Frankia canadensis]|uniref:Antibiotic biosynthesis monooxygenase n=1 Tax=Frankia canadensis TaxID=1836972 RepID=A0A2I2KLG5_9ACTN|nr:antibiotic biosynthesis monooxygenase family protein [Frankia canadensis]SNQ46487.1 Antibiotic biosynthesis monooxygenase [Frankia canadensis]SOU53777.1 Antibiotic biosynthesis monooxygenase [Frankia canadensis]